MMSLKQLPKVLETGDEIVTAREVKITLAEKGFVKNLEIYHLATITNTHTVIVDTI
jgi:hypothetical protein